MQHLALNNMSLAHEYLCAPLRQRYARTQSKPAPNVDLAVMPSRRSAAPRPPSLGMQHLALNNMSLAHEYLCAAHAMSTGAAPGSVHAAIAWSCSPSAAKVCANPIQAGAECGSSSDAFVSHMLADHSPEEPYTYLAIGVYYLSVSKVAEARRFWHRSRKDKPSGVDKWLEHVQGCSVPGCWDSGRTTLSTHYNLAENPDILLSRAEALYTQCRFAEALELTGRLIARWRG
jgi:tetratricopeptide (TPR) repeat protein